MSSFDWYEELHRRNEQSKVLDEVDERLKARSDYHAVTRKSVELADRLNAHPDFEPYSTVRAEESSISDAVYYGLGVEHGFAMRILVEAANAADANPRLLQAAIALGAALETLAADFPEATPRAENRLVPQSTAERRDRLASLEEHLEELEARIDNLGDDSDGPNNWFGTMDVSKDIEAEVFLQHREEARLDRITGSKNNAIGRLWREVTQLTEEFGYLLPPEMTAIWHQLDRSLLCSRRLENAVYYNAGVERGLELEVTTKALRKAGIATEAVDRNMLFALSTALADVARRLPAKDRPNDSRGTEK